MDQGERRVGGEFGAYFAPSPLRYVALAVTLIGIVLTFALSDGSLGVYVLVAGLLLGAADDVVRGEPGLGVLVAGLAGMVLASEVDWTVPFYLSVAVIAVGALAALRRRRTQPRAGH